MYVFVIVTVTVLLRATCTVNDDTHTFICYAHVHHVAIANVLDPK
jgi:hypothetical protein